MNELYVIIFAKKGTMVGRLAFRTRADAETYLASRRGRGDRYKIERYLPAPISGGLKGEH